MNIVFDNIVYSWQRFGGISVVWTNLLTRIVNRGDDITILEDDRVMNNISRSSITLPKEMIRNVSSSFFAIRRYINPRVQLEKPFVFHSSYFRTSDNPNAINVTTVHDFTYELFVKNPIKRWIHTSKKNASIRKSDAVVCISENTKRDLLRFVPDVDPQKVHVIYNGVDTVFRQLENVKKKDFALFVGRRDAYKNFTSIIKPLADCGVPLVIVGSPLSNDEMALLEETKISYEYLGVVDNEKLNLLYNEALCLLFPSLYEGFGLPVVEAQMAGCPVIAFDASSIPEVISSEECLLRDFSYEEIAAKIQLVSDEHSRKALVEKGLANAKNFTWDRVADQYYKLYQSLLEKKRS